MHLRIERASSSGIAQRCDGFIVAALLRERDSEVECGNGIFRADIENGAKRALGLSELPALEMIPSLAEVRVD
jgi:hypothetical protein